MRCDVWWAHPAAETPALYGLLDAVERERYAGYRRDVDKLRFLTGRALIRAAVAAELGIEAGQVRLDSSCFGCGKPHGKPKVVGAELEVSVSHSGDWVVLALTEGAPVGVDVEEVRQADVGGLAEIAFSKAELAEFAAVAEEERREVFFTNWSRKEAVLKATGKGMSVPMSKLTLTGPGQAPGVVASEVSEVDVARVHLVDLDAGPGYRAALAVFGDTPPDLTVRDGKALLVDG